MWAFTQNSDYCNIPSSVFINTLGLFGKWQDYIFFTFSPSFTICSPSGCVRERERERGEGGGGWFEWGTIKWIFFFHVSTDYPHHENTNRYFNPTRRKRHSAKRISRGVREKSVEILVVVDKYVYWKHGRQNITTYILSIFNIVSQILVFSEFLIKNR